MRDGSVGTDTSNPPNYAGTTTQMNKGLKFYYEIKKSEKSFKLCQMRFNDFQKINNFSDMEYSCLSGEITLSEDEYVEKVTSTNDSVCFVDIRIPGDLERKRQIPLICLENKLNHLILLIITTPLAQNTFLKLKKFWGF